MVGVWFAWVWGVLVGTRVLESPAQLPRAVRVLSPRYSNSALLFTGWPFTHSELASYRCAHSIYLALYNCMGALHYVVPSLPLNLAGGGEDSGGEEKSSGPGVLPEQETADCKWLIHAVLEGGHVLVCCHDRKMLALSPKTGESLVSFSYDLTLQ